MPDNDRLCEEDTTVWARRSDQKGWYFYLNSNETGNSLLKGTKIGTIIGIVWDFPPALTMAAVHKKPISYQITNTFYHIFAQGIGGTMILFMFKNIIKLNEG